MDVWTAIKKGMIFIILSIFILMLVKMCIRDRYIADVTQKLSENHQYYLLRVFYYYLLGEESIVKDKECYLKIYELLGQNRQILFYEEGILKTKIQNVYQTYKQYYNQLDSVKFDDKMCIRDSIKGD